MFLLSAVLSLMMPVAAAEKPALLAAAPDSPVRLDRAAVLTASEGPPVVLYAATNVTENELEQFTVIAFVFDADGTLKARQTAPGRRTLEMFWSSQATALSYHARASARSPFCQCAIASRNHSMLSPFEPSSFTLVIAATAPFQSPVR